MIFNIFYDLNTLSKDHIIGAKDLPMMYIGF